MIDHHKTASYHAQPDGTVEWMNQTLEVPLRAYTSQPKHNDWPKQLFLIELADGFAINESTGFTTFQLLYNQP